MENWNEQGRGCVFLLFRVARHGEAHTRRFSDLSFKKVLFRKAGCISSADGMAGSEFRACIRQCIAGS